jgi:hypothetical protein
VESAPFDPFDGVDWEAVLAEPEVPPVRENLVGDLEAGIQDADVLLAETRIEEEEVRADLRALESGVRKWNPADLLAAGERTQQVDLRKVAPPRP